MQNEPELSFKFLLAKQIDRLSEISSHAGESYGKKRDNYYAGVRHLQVMLYPYFEDDAKKKGKPIVINELNEYKDWIDKQHEEKSDRFSSKDITVTFERLAILMGFMKRNNLLLDRRGRGKKADKDV